MNWRRRRSNRMRRTKQGQRRQFVLEKLEDRRLLAGVITQVNYFDTWDGGIIRSTDVAGIAYHPPSGNLYLADSEINELSLFNGDNIFATSLSGDQVFREISSGNTEPTGITYNEFDGYFYVTNDTGPKTVTRYDHNLNNPLLVISTKDDVSSAVDPEGITSDPSTGFLYVSDGNGGGKQVLVYNSNLEFQYVFSVSHQGDAEGIAFHAPSNHLFVIDGSRDVIFEYTLTGTMLEEYDISGFSPSPKSPQGLTFGPTSNPNDDPSALALYIADGMKDNFADGRVYEAVLGNLPSNFAPTTSGIADQNLNVGDPEPVIDLFAAFDDFEDPDPALTYTVENNSNPSMVTATTINGSLGTLELTCEPGMTGSADITVRATDTGNPALFVETSFTLNVSPVNQPPTTTGISNVLVAEDANDTIINLFAAFADPEDPDAALTYTVHSISNPALFTTTSVNGAAGTLTLNYAPDANGTADITVRASDTGFPVLSVDTTFTVTITEVNDTPTLTAGSLNDLTVVQNASATSLGLAGLAYGRGGGTDENGQTLSYAVTSVPSPALGNILLSNGSTVVTPGAYTLAQIQGMQFKPAANVFGSSGTFGFTVTDNGTTNGTNDFKTLNQSLLIDVIEFIPDPITLEVRVSASSDDGEEKPTGGMGLTSSDLELTLDKTNQQVVGMRFNGLNIPRGAAIQNAYIQFQADETSSGATNLTIYAEAVDNATTFTFTNGNITSRTTTSSSVAWSPAAWNTKGEAGPAQRTTDIAAVIQEVVNRSGWSSGNSLAIIIEGTGNRVAEAYDGVPAAAPLLHVEYLPSNLAPTTSGIADQNLNVGDPEPVIDLFAAFDDFEDPDPALTYTVENNSNPSMVTATTINGSLGTLELTCEPGMTGSADITVRATDTGNPALFVETSFTLNVSPVNQPPTTTGISNVLVAEDANDSIINLFAAFADPEDPDAALTYTVHSISNPALFTATSVDGGAGTLTLNYAPDANGTADITVRASDTGYPVLSVDTTFTVTITEVNDTPTLTAGSLNDLTVVQNASATSLGLAGLAYGRGGGTDENGQTLSYAVTGVPSPALGNILLSNGSTVVTPGAYTLAQIQGMQFKPAANVFGSSGTFSFTVTDNGTTNGTNDFKTLNQSLLIDVIESVPDPITFEVRVAASSDDGEEKPSGKVSLTSSDLELTTDRTNQQVVGMRFNGLDIPQGAQVQSAYIQFQADESNSISTSLAIYGEATDSATTFTTTTGDISSRTTTSASVAWSPAPWTKGDAGPDQQTSNIAAVIQEIIDRPGWSAGNSMAIILTGTGTRTAEAFDGLQTAAPLLHIEYLPTGNLTPNAVDDAANTAQDTSVTTNVLSNDFLGNTPTAITAVSQGGNGSVTFNSGAGTTTYTPNGGFTGADSYTYTITDNDGDTSTGTVDVTVTDPTAQPVVLRVMGDVPYSSSEYSQLESDLANVSASDEFFVHLGDIKAGSGACDESVYTSVKSSLQTSSLPVFIIPGDNEWNDCPNPAQGWSYWDTHMMRLEDNWSHSFNVLRQPVREENFAFVHSGILFVGLNLVGGTVHDANEWAQRMTDNADWINENFNNFGGQVTSAVVFGHADPSSGARQPFGQDFVTAAQNFGKPILYMMGDEHGWVLDHPFSGAPNVTRVIVNQGVPSVRVSINNDPTDPFSFDQSPLMVSPPAGAQPIDGGTELDANGDGGVSAIDALVIINHLNGQNATQGEGNKPAQGYDTNSDGSVSALDALLVINYLNRSNAMVSPTLSAKSIDNSQLAPIVEEAILQLSNSNPSMVNMLSGLNFEIVDLPGGMLGRTVNNAIQIDVNAAGYGWFVDATPSDNVEFVFDSGQFVAESNSPASGRVDLLTTVLHEIGHKLGLEHTDSDSWMDATLPLGTRRLTDNSFAELTAEKVDRFFELLD